MVIAGVDAIDILLQESPSWSTWQSIFQVQNLWTNNSNNNNIVKIIQLRLELIIIVITG